MFQPRPGDQHQDPEAKINGTTLASVKKFCYLGSVMTYNGSLDEEISQRIAKASALFVRLFQQVMEEP